MRKRLNKRKRKIRGWSYLSLASDLGLESDAESTWWRRRRRRRRWRGRKCGFMCRYMRKRLNKRKRKIRGWSYLSLASNNGVASDAESTIFRRRYRPNSRWCRRSKRRGRRGRRNRRAKRWSRRSRRYRKGYRYRNGYWYKM